MSCITAVTRGYLLSVDARCDCDDDSGRLVIRSGDSIALRMEMAESDALPGTPVGAAWQAFDWGTREPITEVTEFVPGDDMSLVVGGLLHDGREADLRRVSVEVALRFDPDPVIEDGEEPPERAHDLLTAVVEVWVRRRTGSFVPSVTQPSADESDAQHMDFLSALIEGVAQ